MSRKTPDVVIEFIRKNAKGLYNKELTKIVNLHFKTQYTVEQIKGIKSRNKIDSGLTGQFVKGSVPFNKGLKWDDYVDKDTQERMSKTCFQKGKNINHQRHKVCKVGDEAPMKGGYIRVKLGQNKWELKQRTVYKKNFGKLSDRDVVIFKDGNILNFEPDNLACITRDELLTMNKNGLIKDVKEATECGITVAKIKNKIRDIKKGRNK